MQLFFGVILALIGCVVSFVSHINVFINIVWIIYGLLWILHPVCPENFDHNNNKYIQLERIGGIICILIGLIVKFGV